MRTRLSLATALVGVALLGGCAATPTEVTATPEAQTSEDACAAFAYVTRDLALRIVEGSDSSNAEEFKTTMAEMPGRFDEAGLQASDEIADRIDVLIADLPDPVHMLVIDSELYFDDVDSVDRACAAEGFDVETFKWGEG